MSSWSNTKYNWLAGLFLLSGLAGTVLLAFVFAGGAPLGWNKNFTVKFSLGDGAAGLKPGSAVHLGGQEVGRVASIDFDYKKSVVGTGAVDLPVGVLVSLQVRGDLHLYENAIIVLDKPLLGTISSINIADAGDPTKADAKGIKYKEIASGVVVPGGVAPPAFLAQAGFGADQAGQLKSILSDGQEFMAGAKALVGENSGKLNRAVDRATAAVDLFADKLPQWSGSLDKILNTVDSGANRLDPILTKFDGGVDHAVKLIDSVQTVLDDNREHLDNTLKSADALMSGLAGDTLGFVLEAMREVPSITKNVNKMTEDASKISSQLSAEMPGVRRMLASARQAADSAKIGIDEIVSQPWRVFVRPSTKELKEELIYDSARAYATAVGDLRSLSDTLESMANAGNADPEEVKRVVGTLRESIKNTRQKERELENQLFDLLILSKGGTPVPRSPVPPAPSTDKPAGGPVKPDADASGSKP
ncbi:MAG: hypothetical protein AABZ53_07530 [Planctomycetota bacterium]